jgi:hypothetical protein
MKIPDDTTTDPDEKADTAVVTPAIAAVPARPSEDARRRLQEAGKILRKAKLDALTKEAKASWGHLDGWALWKL